MSAALVIFEENPDRIRFFVREELRADEVIMLEHLQGVAIDNDELTEIQDASFDLFFTKVNGDENKIPEWPAIADLNKHESWKEDLKKMEVCKPDRIFYIAFLL